MTILYLYYNQPEAIDFLESIGYPDYDINFLFIDDGSREPLKLDWPNAKVIRIEEDIPWNLEGACNVGFKTLTGKVLRLDIDHYITKGQVEQLKDIEVGAGQIIHFSRIRHDGGERTTSIKVAHNMHMINAGDFNAVGGYDELFVGNYGYGDTDLKRRYIAAGYKFQVCDLILNVQPKFSTKGLDRDMKINTDKFNKKWKRKNYAE